MTDKSQQKKQQKNKQTDTQQEKIETLQQQLTVAQESERRALADYQNIVRRNQEERQHLVKLASKELVSDMLQPLEHLQLAADQIDDQGLNMVIDQFWKTLENHGLKKVTVLGEPFDGELMEVVETDETVDASADDIEPADQDDLVVTKVRRNCYQLNGIVIQHAQVVMGRASSNK